MKEKCYLCGGEKNEDGEDFHGDCKFIILELWDYANKEDEFMIDKDEFLLVLSSYCHNFVCPNCKSKRRCTKNFCKKKAFERLKEYKLIKVKDEWQEAER